MSDIKIPTKTTRPQRTIGRGNSQMEAEASRRKQNRNLLAQDGNNSKYRGGGLRGAVKVQAEQRKVHNQENIRYHKGVLLLVCSILWGTLQVNQAREALRQHAAVLAL